MCGLGRLVVVGGFVLLGGLGAALAERWIAAEPPPVLTRVIDGGTIEVRMPDGADALRVKPGGEDRDGLARER